jgi:hypothetical protein
MQQRYVPVGQIAWNICHVNTPRNLCARSHSAVKYETKHNRIFKPFLCKLKKRWNPRYD